MDKSKCNGCGAMTGVWAWLKPPHHEFFRGQCELHDMLYEIGGSEAARLRADNKLFEDMVAHSVSYFKGRKVGAQVWFICLAYIYYKAVRWFGKSQFNYK